MPLKDGAEAVPEPVAKCPGRNRVENCIETGGKDDDSGKDERPGGIFPGAASAGLADNTGPDAVQIRFRGS